MPRRFCDAEQKADTGMIAAINPACLLIAIGIMFRALDFMTNAEHDGIRASAQVVGCIAAALAGLDLIFMSTTI